MQSRTTQVLLVEDEDAHAELIRLSFETQTGFRLTVATCLREAREYLLSATPDLTIVDSLLPDGKGLELVEDLCQRASHPVILLTSHADEKQQALARAAGVWQYLVKTESTLLDMPETVDRALREWSSSKPPGA